MSNRTTHERLIKRFSRADIRASLIDMFQNEGLSILSDEAAEALARDLASYERLRARIFQENRAPDSAIAKAEGRP